MTPFSHKLRTVALPDDLHARLRVEASRRAKDGEDVRAVAMDLVAGLLGPYLDELEAARNFLADRDIKPDNIPEPTPAPSDRRVPTFPRRKRDTRRSTASTIADRRKTKRSTKPGDT